MRTYQISPATERTHYNYSLHYECVNRLSERLTGLEVFNFLTRLTEMTTNTHSMTQTSSHFSKLIHPKVWSLQLTIFLCVFLQKKSRKICQFLTAIAGCVKQCWECVFAKLTCQPLQARDWEGFNCLAKRHLPPFPSLPPPLFLPITHEVLLCPKSCPSPS